MHLINFTVNITFIPTNMLKLASVLLLILFEIVVCDVCSDNTAFKCECSQKTDERTHLPVSVADCSSHNLQHIPDDIENDVNYLDLSINNIEELDPAQHKLASRNLHVLILSLNRINSIEPDFFQDLPNLRELDLSNNVIPAFGSSQVFQGLKELRRLDLSFNTMMSLPEGLFLPLAKLMFLDLSYSNLGGVLVESRDTLVHTLGVAPTLRHLSLDGLNISEIPSSYFDDFTQMMTLSLADNALSLIPMVPYSVEKLDLSGNRLTFLSGRYLNYHSLKVLKLNRMPSLTDIHHYAFYNLYALEKLIIEDCPNLREFSELAFDLAVKNTNHHPEVLSLARNGLLRLNESYKYYFKNMERVDLRHNSWNCDCDILWMQEFESVFYKPNEMTCSTPGALHNKPILRLEHFDLQECFPEIYGKKTHRILIVGLTCAIIVLCGIIFYLLRYPINLRSDKGLGPFSPYSAASTYENS